MTDTFIKEINILAISAMIRFIDEYPILRSVLAKSKQPSSDWDFFMTVAGAGTYLLKNKSDKKERDELLKQLIEVDRQMPEALNNFIGFIDTSINLDLDKNAIIGIWVLWNIAGEMPTPEDQILALAIGSYLSIIVEDLEK